MKKRLTFSFLPWAAAAGACIGGGFAHGQEPAAPVPADGSVLAAGESAAEPAAVVEDGAIADEAAAPAMRTVRR